MRLRDPDLGKRALAGFPSQLERDDAGYIGLEREDLQVVHELAMRGHRGRDPGRLVDRRQGGVPRLGACDAPLDLAHGIQVFGEAHTIGGADLPCEAGDLLRDRVQDALVYPA